MSGAQFGGSIKLQGAQSYKEDLANINSNLKLLSKEMAVYGKSVEDLTQKTNLCNDKINTQKRHIEEIEEALKRAKQQYGENSDEAQRWATKLNNAEAVLLDMEKELKAAQKELDDMTDKFKQSAEKLKSAGEGLQNFGNLISGLSKGAAAAVTAVTAVGLQSAETADELLTLSKVTGLSTDELQKFAYAADLIDVSQETITGSLKKLTANMSAAQGGTGKQAEAFKRLRVEYIDANGALRQNTEVFYEIIDALGKVENSTERDALAMTLFGKNAQELNPLILQGSEALKQMGAEAENAGLILEQETLEDMAKLQDGVDRLKATMKADMTKLGVEIAPVLTPILEDILGALSRLMEKLSKFDSKTIETGLKVGVFVAALAPALISLGKLMVAVSQIIPMLGKLQAAMAAMSATTAVLLAVGAAVAALSIALEKANADLDETMQTNRDVNQSLQNQSTAYKDATKQIEDKTAAERAETETARELARRFEELASKTDRTSTEEAELAGVVDKLNQKFPDLKLSVDDTTQSIDGQVKAIDELIKAQERAIETTEAMEKWQAAKSNLAGVESTRWSARDSVTAAMRGLDPQQRQALAHVISDYNKEGIYRIAEIDKVAKALMKNDSYDGDMRAIDAFKRAMMDAQLAENSYVAAVGELDTARKNYRDKLAAQGTGSVKAAAGGKVSDTKDLSDKVKEGIETWQYRYDAGIISTEEYIKELTRIRDAYFAEDSKAWREYNLKIINLQKSLEKDKGTAAVSSAKKTASAVKEIQDDSLKKSYEAQQAKSYDWISERVFRGDFGEYGTTAKESYDRIYQRALEAYQKGLLDIDALPDEADRIKAAKLNDYKTEKQKLVNFIDDRNFYDDWAAVNTTEEKVLQQMLDNADRYYNEGILSYKEYLEEVRQLNRSIYSAQAAGQESALKISQERIERQLQLKRQEIDAQISALNKEVSDLRESYTTQDRQKRLAELKDEIQDFSRAVTIKGQEHLKSLQEEQEKLRREQEIEDLQKKNAAIIEELEAEYEAMEAEKTSLLTKIADNTAELATLKDAIANIGEGISSAMAASFTKIVQDNSIKKNYNNNNVNQYITAAQTVDVLAAMNAALKGLK